VPATEVARRAGHGVAVLLKIYAHCIDGQATAANQRITEALGIPEGPHRRYGVSLVGLQGCRCHTERALM
jgi:hypothetical protein